LTDRAFTADGWYKTGDFGYFDQEARVHVLERVSDLICLPSGRLVLN
jgi:long-chain acyl-CoA synthetase